MTLTPFHNDEFELAVIADGDTFRVLAPQLAKALGFREAFDLLRSIPESEKGSELARTLGGEQRVGYVTEPGFYRALGQRQPARITDEQTRAQVERFQNWVYGEVLPAIRKTGGYGRPQVPDLSALSPDALDYLAGIGRALEAVTKEAKRNAAKAAAYDQFIDGSGCYLIDSAANLLGIKHRELWTWLYGKGYLIKKGHPRHRQPKALPKTRGWFAVKTYATDRTNGKARVTTYLTVYGLDRVRQELVAEGLIEQQLFAIPSPRRDEVSA